MFDNLNMCHTTDGIAPIFADSAERKTRCAGAPPPQTRQGVPGLSAPEMFALAIIAKQLLEAGD